VAAALVAELVISFLLMTTVLNVSNSRHAKFTGLAAGLAVATFILVEAPISGMSMNPARSLGPAVVSGNFRHLWIYFVAPPAGMLLAAEAFVRRRGLHRVLCAKLNHAGAGPCIFHCHFDELQTARPRERAIA
jgi:aquaporin Z